MLDLFDFKRNTSNTHTYNYASYPPFFLLRYHDCYPAFVNLCLQLACCFYVEAEQHACLSVQKAFVYNIFALISQITGPIKRGHLNMGSFNKLSLLLHF